LKKFSKLGSQYSGPLGQRWLPRKICLKTVRVVGGPARSLTKKSSKRIVATADLLKTDRVPHGPDNHGEK